MYRCSDPMTVRLFNADCRSVLPDIGSVDTLITDPVWPNCPPGLLQGWDYPHELLRSTLQMVECRRLVIVMRNDSDPRFLTAVPDNLPFFHAAQLPYVMPGHIGRKLGGDELAYCFGEPLPSAPGRRVIPGRAKAAQPFNRRPNGHPCSRALSHFRWLVNWWTLPGETVLDPFMGSGTTGVACVEMGRNFIGVEIDPVYFGIAEERIRNTPTPLFDL